MNMCVWKEREIEEELLADVSIEEPWALLETFNQLVRNSGSGEERQAVEYLTGRLAEWGVEYKVYEPELF
ncbi:MAG: peptidase M28, partial [bacterium]